ncbi:hypothetical protein ABE83_00190 [Streptomyces sp. CFMR 7]|nr:hypothetical protein ABE83_00190 [Streptomyces sp. CFMR 7]
MIRVTSSSEMPWTVAREIRTPHPDSVRSTAYCAFEALMSTGSTGTLWRRASATMTRASHMPGSCSSSPAYRAAG